MKQGKNHVSWNENPPESSLGNDEKCGKDNDGIGSPPRITKTTKVTNSAQYEEMKKKLEKLKKEERQVDRYLDYLKQQAAVYNGRQPPSAEHAPYLPPGFGNINITLYSSFLLRLIKTTPETIKMRPVTSVAVRGSPNINTPNATPTPTLR